MTDNLELPFSSGTLTLKGTLTVPNTGPCTGPSTTQSTAPATTPAVTPSPAALLISGSGPIDRNSNSKQLSIDVMGQLATHLAAGGFASLRYDKRGVGKSDGDYHSAGLHDNIADARAALEALRSRPEVDPNQIFVIGHSEGAFIASELADDDRLAGVVLLAGAAHTGHDVVTWQARQIAPTLPRPVRWLMKLLRQDLLRTQSKRLARLAATTEDVVRIQFVKVNAKWFREFLSFDPGEALRRAEVPVLAITGSKDIQIDPADISLMEELVPTSFTGHVVEDITHLLRSEAGPPSIRTYKKQARRPIDEGVVTLVADWMAALTRHPNGAQQ